ncbi:protein SGT1 homolog B-like protein [Tanacetum coccineum]
MLKCLGFYLRYTIYCEFGYGMRELDLLDNAIPGDISRHLLDSRQSNELTSSNAKAYLRKGTACFSLEEYDTAKTAFEAGCKLAPDDARFTDWIKKCEKCIAEEDGELLTESLDVAPTNVVASSQATEKTDATSG